ncbi:MAG: ABC transporter substrate-binding protein, partial [Moorea sp. SIO2B7]|nr:ABC transporter substrate-binding protein [Moorena sp. SIO2B7]
SNVWFTDGNLHMFNQKPQPGRKPIEGREVADWEEKISNLYIEGARELDEEKRKEIYAETQHLTEEYLPFIYLVNLFSLTAVRNRFEGIKYSALGGAFWNIDELRLTDE